MKFMPSYLSLYLNSSGSQFDVLQFFMFSESNKHPSFENPLVLVIF